MTTIPHKDKIARLLFIEATKNSFTTYNNKYIQAIYLLSSLKFNVVKSFMLIDDKEYDVNSIPHELTQHQKEKATVRYTLTPPNYAYRQLEIRNYIYLETSEQWVKVTEPVQIEMNI